MLQIKSLWGHTKTIPATTDSLKTKSNTENIASFNNFRYSYRYI